jgi:hypothetical protein
MVPHATSTPATHPATPTMPQNAATVGLRSVLGDSVAEATGAPRLTGSLVFENGDIGATYVAPQAVQSVISPASPSGSRAIFRQAGH